MSLVQYQFAFALSALGIVYVLLRFSRLVKVVAQVRHGEDNTTKHNILIMKSYCYEKGSGYVF